jgi:anti-sigma factor RsiW
MSNHEAMEQQGALYALDALAGTELAEFERHLGLCDICQLEVAHYQSAAANLVHDDVASDETWQRISVAISVDDEAIANVVPLRGSGGNDSTPWKWVASIAAAAALLFGGFLVAQLLTGSELTGDNVVAAAERAAEQPDSIVSDFLVDGSPVAQLVLAADGRGYVIPTDQLEALDVSRTYQLWVINDTADVISAGVLGADPGPATFTWTGDVSGFALTREVAGGVVSSAGDVVSVIEDV